MTTGATTSDPGYARKPTPTQQRILDMLSDGQPHTPDELRTCLNDELSEPQAIRVQISFVRKLLKPLGQGILCFKAPNPGGMFYQQVRFLTSPYNGRS